MFVDIILVEIPVAFVVDGGVTPPVMTCDFTYGDDTAGETDVTLAYDDGTRTFSHTYMFSATKKPDSVPTYAN